MIKIARQFVLKMEQLWRHFTLPEISISKKDQLSVDKPCLVLISEDAVSVSNPAHTAMEVKLNWAGKVFTVKLKADGSSVTVKF